MSVLPEETRSRALFTAKTVRTIKKPVDKPLETDRYFAQYAAQQSDNPVDETAADERLCLSPPIAANRPVCKKI